MNESSFVRSFCYAAVAERERESTRLLYARRVVAARRRRRRCHLYIAIN